MPADPLLKLIDATSEILELTGPVIEKDYYVTQLIHALSEVENEHFGLVFAGGTCLAKAHKIVKRMSEDIDFKIQFKTDKSGFSKTQFLKTLKNFRSYLISKLTLPGFIIANMTVRNEGHYLRAL
ncbi:MAG: hypothetical protein K0S11_1189 [Gammaproteobacteria bacterium]|jgi:predicted nucleotidyltransferase component of viral defense system|nr:hypothetical protein [Gammaproteobacteria bacterium]